MQVVPGTPMVTGADGAVFSYLEKGSGPAVVCLHGIGSGARSWQSQLDGLAGEWRVIAWDAPGYGSSTPLPMPEPTATDYSARLRSFLSALGVGRVHLVGHSLGAVMAARFAAEHPQQVVSVTLANPSSGHARLPQEEREQLKRSRLDDLARLGPRGLASLRGPRLVSPQASDAVRDAVVETMGLVRPDGYQQAVALLSGADTRADLVRLPSPMPVQFVIGEADVVTPPAGTRTLAAARPSAWVRSVENAGHAVYLERPTEFNELLLEFTRSCEAATA